MMLVKGMQWTSSSMWAYVIFCVLSIAAVAVNGYSIGGHVIGGTPALEGEFPEMVSVHMGLVPLSINHLCGGVLVTPEWVLSAGRCVEGEGSSLSVTAGITTRTQEGLTGSQTRTIDYYRLPPKYCHNCLSYPGNIALLHLTNPFDMEVENIALSKLPEAGSDFTGHSCQMLGWGTTGGIQLSQALLKTTMPIISNAQCTDMMSDLSANDHHIFDDTFCAFDGTSALCHYDQGGPILCPDEQGAAFTAGVGSWWVPTLLDNCREDKPSVFTSVADFRAWIDGVIA